LPVAVIDERAVEPEAPTKREVPSAAGICAHEAAKDAQLILRVERQEGRVPRRS